MVCVGLGSILLLTVYSPFGEMSYLGFSPSPPHCILRYTPAGPKIPSRALLFVFFSVLRYLLITTDT